MAHIREEAKDINSKDIAARVHRWTATALLGVMALDLVAVILERRWQDAFTVSLIMAVTASPILFRKRLPVNIPPEFQALTLLFLFAALFLGEVKSFYEWIWWWDIALHATSGLLLGLLGFLLVYVLNENERVDMHMRPRFVAFFAFAFAASMGVLWEIFEFGMDSMFGTQMQKPMFDDPSGLTDTMWDLIVDILGAAVISTLGWWYMRHERQSPIEASIRRFIARNPHLFRSSSRHGTGLRGKGEAA